MNLWKRKGKAYRDEDGNLTAGSVAKEMALGLVGDLASIVTYGEEIADIVGNILTGDKWYGIDTPGLEQLSDVVETIVEQGQNGLDVLKDAADVVKNGGSLGEYLHRHSGDIVGGIKDLAAAAATYLPGISVNNLVITHTGNRRASCKHTLIPVCLRWRKLTVHTLNIRQCTPDHF